MSKQTYERPLSADVADRFTRTSQERAKALVGDEHATGAVVPEKDYRIEYEAPNGVWFSHRVLGTLKHREAVQAFSHHIREWDSNSQFRLVERAINPWRVTMTQEALDLLDEDGS